MQDGLTLEIEKEAEGTVVRIKGEIDIFSADGFKKRIYEVMQDDKRDLVFDCRNLKYIDSTGLGAFVSFLKRSKQQGTNIKLNNVRSGVMKLFVITGLDRIIDMEKEVV